MVWDTPEHHLFCLTRRLEPGPGERWEPGFLVPTGPGWEFRPHGARLEGRGESFCFASAPTLPGHARPLAWREQLRAGEGFHAVTSTTADQVQVEVAGRAQDPRRAAAEQG